MRNHCQTRERKVDGERKKKGNLDRKTKTERGRDKNRLDKRKTLSRHFENEL